LTAFDRKEIKRLGLAEDAVQDAIPAPPASPVARLGQIWQLGASIGSCAAILRAPNAFQN
jgi:hypothetical protein